MLDCRIATKIRIGSPTSRYDYTFTSNALTKSDGAFVFRGTPPGTWTLYYKVVNNWVKLVTFEVKEKDLDLGKLSPETEEGQ